MDKPKFLLPFIYVYKIVKSILHVPFKFIKYFSVGFFLFVYVLSYTMLNIITNILIYCLKGIRVILIYTFLFLSIFFEYTNTFLDFVFRGFVYSCYFVYKQYFRVYIIVYVFYRRQKKISKITAQIKEEERERRRKENEARQKELEAKKQEIIEAKKQEREEAKKYQELDAYKGDNVKLEKKPLGERINDLLEKMIKGPTILKKAIVNYWNNLALVKNRNNKLEVEKEQLLSSFDKDKDDRSKTKQLFEYVAKNPEGKVVKGYFDAYSRVEVHSFLLSEGMEVYSIRTNKLIRALYGNAGGGIKFKVKDLIFFLTQLSTYIKAGIPLVESLKILTNQFNQKSYQRVLRSIIYDLTMGDAFSEAMSKQGKTFPQILINMVKTAEMTGQLAEVLDDMADYFSEIDKTRKQMLTVMMYPMIIFTISIGVIGFILMFVIPRFVQIYESMDSSQIPEFTLFIMRTSEFLQDNIGFIILGFIVFVLIFRYLYVNVKLFKTMVQWSVMKSPAFGDVVIYNEITMFSKTFSSLLSHNVFITDSMEILNKITNNEIFKMLILDTITNLAKGDKISKSFKEHWAFPVPAYEMIVTGEKTGQLPEMMAKVAEYYQELHSNSVTRLKTFIEPFLIIFLTVVVGGIVLAIIIPMFNMYQTIQG